MTALRAMAVISISFLTPSPRTVPRTQYAKSIFDKCIDEKMKE